MYLSIQKRFVITATNLFAMLRSRVEVPTTPGWSVPGRAIVLPYAIGSDEGFADFHVSRSDGCSSLLPIDYNESHHLGGNFWTNLCGKEGACGCR